MNNKYNSGKIYKIIDNTNNNIYIGSTIETLKRRLQRHINDYKRNIFLTSKEIIKNGDYKIELLENYPCNNKRELEKREQEYIDNLKSVNKSRAYSTNENIKMYYKNYHKEYEKKNKNKISEYKKIYNKKIRTYRYSWGGDMRYSNNLLLINTNLFE
jgi:hypothetical protein